LWPWFHELPGSRYPGTGKGAQTRWFFSVGGFEPIQPLDLKEKTLGTGQPPGLAPGGFSPEIGSGRAPSRHHVLPAEVAGGGLLSAHRISSTAAAGPVSGAAWGSHLSLGRGFSGSIGPEAMK
jgi:hypothetical protein